MEKEDEIKNLVKGVIAESKRIDAEAAKTEKEKKGEKEEEETFNCPECGEKVRANQKYCPGCGTELEWEA